MDEPAVDASPRVSGLAVSSLVFGLLCCIPLSGLLGTILGGAALVRISKADGRLSGRGLAFTGLILGLLGSMLWIGVGVGGIWVMKQAQQFVQPVYSIATGDFAAAKQRLSADTAAKLTDEKAKEFTDQVKTELGAFKSMPKGAMDWIRGWGELGPMIQSSQKSGRSDGIPVPVQFDKETALVMIYLDEKHSGPGIPPIKNLSIHTKAGKTIWLVPPD